MSKIFTSYHRRSQAIAVSLVQDLEAMGHTVWFDQELAGGQSWWDAILQRIREADAFVFVLDADSVDSVACKREYTYASDLGKSVVPVLTSEGVSINLLPPALSRIQLVDYRNQGREAVLRLAKALMALPPAPPLPDPLPPAPAVPLSYLGTLTEQVDQAAALSYEAQSALLVDLRANARDPETRADAVTLLRRLRKRRDLFASVGDEIDDILRADPNERQPVAEAPGRAEPPPLPSVAEPAPASPIPLHSPPGPSAPSAAVGARQRLQMAAAGWGICMFLFILATAMVDETSLESASTFVVMAVVAMPWAVAAAVAGRSPLALKAAVAAGAAAALITWVSLGSADAILAGIVVAGPALIVGAIVGKRLQRKRTAAASPAHS